MRRKDFSKQILIFGSAMLMALPLAIPAASAQQLTPEKQQEVDALSQQIKSNPNDYLLYAKRGFIYKKAGKMSNANLDFEQALTVNPAWQQGYFLKAEKLKAEKRFEEALKQYDQAEKIGPLSAKALVVRGNTYWDMKKFTNAQSDYTKAIGLDSSLADAYVGRALLKLEQSGPNSDSVEDLKKAVQLNPSDKLSAKILNETMAKLHPAKP